MTGMCIEHWQIVVLPIPSFFSQEEVEEKRCLDIFADSAPLQRSSTVQCIRHVGIGVCELGSTCAVHSKTSKVEQIASEYCPAFVWQDWQNLFR